MEPLTHPSIHPQTDTSTYSMMNRYQSPRIWEFLKTRQTGDRWGPTPWTPKSKTSDRRFPRISPGAPVLPLYLKRHHLHNTTEPFVCQLLAHSRASFVRTPNVSPLNQLARTKNRQGRTDTKRSLTSCTNIRNQADAGLAVALLGWVFLLCSSFPQ